MKCPHCLESFHPQPITSDLHQVYHRGRDLLRDSAGVWRATSVLCPACDRATIWLMVYDERKSDVPGQTIQVWPQGVARSPLPATVPEEFAADYREACLVLADSPKASAALSRRCLQHILREHAKVKKGNLSSEIDEVLLKLPSYLAEAVDAIRNVGNFAAHPTKSTNTGEIVPVEPGEAEWLLDVLEGLFDHYFVQPAVLAAKQAALDKKLTDAGKPPMKKPTP